MIIISLCLFLLKKFHCEIQRFRDLHYYIIFFKKKLTFFCPTLLVDCDGESGDDGGSWQRRIGRRRQWLAMVNRPIVRFWAAGTGGDPWLMRREEARAEEGDLGDDTH